MNLHENMKFFMNLHRDMKFDGNTNNNNSDNQTPTTLPPPMTTLILATVIPTPPSTNQGEKHYERCQHICGCSENHIFGWSVVLKGSMSRHLKMDHNCQKKGNKWHGICESFMINMRLLGR